ncbi:MAG: hypothetical protein MUO19_00620 [Dehalococcoidales bacterium]|nr:hypothetical protein [Dehalococcoidales bacterium]
MNRPPLLMNVRIRGENSRYGFFLPLPLFLLLPLALVILIILSPLILIGIVVLWPSGWGKRALLSLGAAMGVYCAIRGLKVDIRGSQQIVKISVI